MKVFFFRDSVEILVLLLVGALVALLAYPLLSEAGSPATSSKETLEKSDTLQLIELQEGSSTEPADLMHVN